MKINISIYITILFITLSIWLSFSFKKTNEAFFHAESQIKAMEHALNVSKNHTGILQEALKLNIGKAPVQIYSYNPSGFGNGSQILYLKAHACNPCNMPVIEGLINLATASDNFQIVSHTTNRHFLQPVIQNNGLSGNERVNWLNGKLYEYHRPLYDAELLFVDSKGFILGVLPLELLKERVLFETWLAPLYSSNDSNSSDE